MIQPHPLLADPLRIPVEQAVSAQLGRAWRVVDFQDLANYASHPAALLSDGAYSVFVKLGEGARSQDQFTKEVAGLRLLTELSGVQTPIVIANVAVGADALLIMQAEETIHRDDQSWRGMGQALAQIHSIKGGRYGLDWNCYWGDLTQDNSPDPDWPTFFWQRRIAPRLRGAVDSGHLPLDLVLVVERLQSRLSELCGPVTEPTLLHGDAHLNNILSTVRGPVFIDPAVYYGHPEMELAYVDIFSPVSDELFQGYAAVTPIERDFSARRNLWRLPFYLAMVEVAGPQHIDVLLDALRGVGSANLT